MAVQWTSDIIYTAESLAHVAPDLVSEKLFSVVGHGIGITTVPDFETELKMLLAAVSTLQDLVLVSEGQRTEKTAESELGSWLYNVTQAMDSTSELVNELQVEISRRKAAARERTMFWSIKREVRSLFSRSNSLAPTISRIQEVRKKLEENIVIATENSKFNSFLNGKRVVDNMHVMRARPRHVGMCGKPRKREMMTTTAGGPDNIIIGRDQDKKNIIEILRRSVEGENVSVLPIVGVGGIGKTTLTRWVYEDSRIAAHFDERMWVCVSESFNITKIIKEMIRCSATGEKCGGDLTLDQLQTLMRNILDGKRFLLVLDDVWNRDREEWLKLRALLLGGSRGSKIVITTRKVGVGPIMGTIRPYVLCHLGREDSWHLFRKHAGGIERQDDQCLIEFGRQIVEKCGGIPLQVRMLGSLMYSSKGEEDWISVRDDEIWRLEYFPALKLSYERLPSRLKPCFAFCSIFPKNSEIISDDLVQLWVMNDLIKPTTMDQNSNELEEIAVEYIKELVERSFFQDFKERDHGARFSIRIHDLLHDIAVSVAHKENVMVSFGAKNIPRSIRHVSFSDEDWSRHEQRVQNFLGEMTADVQTILCPVDGVGLNSETIVSTFFDKFKSLKMLDLSDSGITALPESICNLIKLRYLSLRRNDRIMKLPNSISELTNLEALMLGGCSKLENLPYGVGFMVKLRHLEVATKEEAVLQPNWMKKSGRSLTYLGVVGCVNLKSLFGRWESFTALRSLFIHKCPSLVSLPRGIRNLPALQILRMDDCETLDLLIDEDDDLDDKVAGDGYRSLWLLVIVKLPKLETLPRWILQAAAAATAAASNGTLQRIVIESCPNFRGLPHGAAPRFFNSFQKFKIEDCPQSTCPSPRTMKKRNRMRIFRTHTLPGCKKVGQPKLLEEPNSMKLGVSGLY